MEGHNRFRAMVCYNSPDKTMINERDIRTKVQTLGGKLEDVTWIIIFNTLHVYKFN